MPTYPTLKELKYRLSYEPNTGKFTWVNSASVRASNGSIAGSTASNGYRYIRLNGKLYQDAHLAWLYMTGQWPTDQIDHKNRNPLDNKWSNLRLATSSQNNANRKGVRTKHHNLPKGVVPQNRKGWGAQLKHKGKTTRLGYFSTVEEAHTAYVNAAKRIWGDYVSDV